MATRPTFRNLTDSYEGWAYRKGFARQLAVLQQRNLVEARQAHDGSRLHRLTEAGRVRALGKRDPATQWNRRWDGKWRMVIFDVPQSQASDRVQLRRVLSGRGFGYLQKSVWITPDPLVGEREAMGDGLVDVGSLILLEARPCAGERDEAIVASAWDFPAINESYESHGRILDQLPRQPLESELVARQLHRWLREERLAWKDAMQLDPLLPERLLPPGYQGVRAWKRRLELMTGVGDQLRRF